MSLTSSQRTSGPPTNRQKAALETRRRLMDAAADLMAEKGFANVSVDDIVHRCGVARGTFYIYFRNKEDIGFAITRQPFADMREEIDSMPGSPAEKMRVYLVRFFDPIETTGLPITQQWVRNVIDPASVPEGYDSNKLDYDQGMLKDILRTMVQRKELRADTPTDDIAGSIIAELYGVMVCWCMSGGSYDPRAALETYASTQLVPMIDRYTVKER